MNDRRTISGRKPAVVFDRDLWLLLVLAVLKLAFHTATNGQYGFHRDELQTLSDARSLDWGFVPYPPLVPFLGRIEWVLFGESLTGFRFFAAAAQCTAMVLAGLMARRFGGGRAAMLVATFAVAIAPISLAASSLFQYTSFDYLWVVLLAYCIVRRIDSDDARWWLAIGAVVGLGMMTKYTMLLFAAGIGIGVLFTPLRDDLRSKWPWLGIILAIVVVLPNLLWQVEHHFIYLDFVKEIHARDVRIGRAAGFWIDQLTIATNLLTLPLWLLGLYFLFFAADGRRFRIVGWLAVIPVALFALAQGRGYYAGPVYPMLFAGGAAQLQQVLDRRGPALQRVGWGVTALLLLAGSIVVPVVLPLVPVNSSHWAFVNDKQGDFREEFGWPELTREVARIWNGLSAEERSHAGIIAGNYGEAGAIELYAPAYALPPVISDVNSFWLRGPGDPVPQNLVVVGGKREELETVCASVELAGHTGNDAHVSNEETERHPDIFICRGLRQSLDKLWPKLLHFG
jgi:Dolichyl-phosphate-mannose-protein mannosyltransferase